MALAAKKQIRDSLLQALVKVKALDAEKAIEIFHDAYKEEMDVYTYLQDKDIVSEHKIASACSITYIIPQYDASTILQQFIPEKTLNERFIHSNQIVPLYKRGNSLFIGLYQPSQLQLVQEVEFETQLQVKPVFVQHSHLQEIIHKNFSSIEVAVAGSDKGQLDNLAFDEKEEDAEDTSDQPIVQFINKILLDAINQGASDIHFEPYEDRYRIRFRQDGMLREVFNPPIKVGNRLASRIKIMARLNISERRIPQDGQITLKLSKHKTIGFRVSTCPILSGEKIVLRLLNTSSAMLSISTLGMNDKQLEDYRNSITRPYGLILVTGPTGSGKTVTQYSALNQLNAPDKNILTIEDPVEIPMEGINQVNINNKAGLTFASALRSFLRQDPDIIMVGEIRDLETAEIAIKAAQTGHLVFSTLHTNDAPQTLTRLSNMGVAPFNIASSVLVILAQRLLRKLCENCKEPVDIPKEALLKEGFNESDLEYGISVYRPVGCPKCNEGYRGRTGIYQVLPVSDAIERLILEGGNTLDLAAQSQKEGVLDLRQSGLEKVAMGLTSLEELNRVTKD